ncbi:MAG: M36 family metallopeptidase [Acidobacteriota bacterium]
MEDSAGEDPCGNGGAGSDSVIANAQASGNCNANFGTPSDGSNPTMNMYTCDIATPSRDGDFDNGVVAHEYGHGISNRLTGGASVSCLNNSEQMGEGWSDWFGLIMTIEPGDLGTDPRGIGTWLLGQGPDGLGVRTQRYSTDTAVYTHTYSDIGGMAIPHGVGEVWASMLWEMTWALIEEHGFNPLIDDVWSAGGNNLASQLVMDGMKLQPCSPGFVDGRDAILLADQNLTGGANQCLIWAAFAKRGLGFGADQGSSSSTTDGTEAFDTPAFCDFLNPTPTVVDVCVGNDAVFDIDVNDAFTPPVTLSATGNPSGSTTSFSPNPVNGPLPVTATLTVGSIDAGAVGSHAITIAGNDGVNIEDTDVELNVFPNSLGASTLIAPADGATNVGPMPEMSWSAVAGTATYLLEIDNDPGFGSVDYSVAVSSTVHEVTSFLDALTTYYWRVTPSNLCATGTTSSVFSFTTPNVSCGSFSSADVPLPIPEGGGTDGTTVSTLDIGDSGEIISLTVTLEGTHTYMGDLDFNLASPVGTSVMFIEQSCGGDNDFDLTLDDAAAGSFPCPPIGGGTYLPSNPLAPFNGEEVNGQWTLTINDNFSGDTGTLNAWSMNICITAPGEPPFFADGFETGDVSGWSSSMP